MKATLYLQYKQATITVDLSEHMDAVIKLMNIDFFDIEDKRVHRHHLMHRQMRNVLNTLRIDAGIREMLRGIELSMKQLIPDFDMEMHISNVNASVFTIDTRS